MQNFTELKKWLRNGISETPLMLHGTNIGAVFETVKTGVMPTGVLGIIDLKDDPFNDHTDGRLYFIPVDSSKFEEEKYDKLTVLSKESCFKDAKDYAEMSGFANYLAVKLDCRTPELYDIFNVWQGKHLEWKEIQDELRKHKLNLSLRQIISLDSQARKRKGIIIEPKNSILELPHEPDCTSLYFECSDGLNKKYIKGMKLLGPVEERLMERFLDDRFNYNGFKIVK